MQGGDSGRSESGAPTYVGSNVNVLWPLAHSEREWGRMGPWCTLVAAWHGCAKGERFGGVRGTGIASWGIFVRADGSGLVTDNRVRTGGGSAVAGRMKYRISRPSEPPGSAPRRVDLREC